MKLPKLRFWGTDEKFNGLIFFAQTIDEMLFHFTLDSYKSPICNVHTLLEELEQALDDAEKMNLGKEGTNSYIKPICDEFCNKISYDFVARKMLEQRYGKTGYDKILHNFVHWTNKEEYNTFIQSLNRFFDDHYYNHLKIHLHESINQNNYPEIHFLCQSFIPELIIRKYSPEFIFYNNDSYFYKENIFSDTSKIDLYIENFFNLFSGEEKKYDVILHVSEQFQSITSFLHYLNVQYEKNNSDKKIDFFIVAPAQRTSDDLYEKLFLNGKYEGLSKECPYFLIFRNQLAIDPFQAKESVKFTLNIINSFLAYCTYYIQIKWDDIFLVYSSDNIPIITKKPVSPLAKNKKFERYYNISGTGEIDLSELCKKQEELLFTNFADSSYQLYKSLSLHASAINSKNIENQYLNSWICLEILLPNYLKKPLLEKFKVAFLPLLNRRYINKLLENFYRDLEFNNSMSLEDFFSDFPCEFQKLNTINKCAAMLSVSDPSIDLVRKATTKMGRNPLLNYRIEELHEKLKTGQSIKKTFDDHNQRVEWHLARLYRARNLLTHLGERISNLDKLLENVNFYFHIVIEQIEDISEREKHLSSLDAAYEWSTIEQSAYIDYLKENNKTRLTYENFEALLFGKYSI